MNGGRLFVHAKMDPYTLVPSITKIIRDLASDQPVERAGDARRHPRRSAVADARQRAGVQRIRRRRAGHRGRRRGRRAGVLGQRADARVRRAPGHRLDAVGAAHAHPQGRRGHRRQRHRRRRRSAGSSLARVVSRFITEIEMPGAVPIVGAAAGAGRRGHARVADAGGEGVARRGGQRAARGLRRRPADVRPRRRATMRGPMSTSQRRVSRR